MFQPNRILKPDFSQIPKSFQNQVQMQSFSFSKSKVISLENSYYESTQANPEKRNYIWKSFRAKRKRLCSDSPEKEKERYLSSPRMLDFFGKRVSSFRGEESDIYLDIMRRPIRNRFMKRKRLIFHKNVMCSKYILSNEK